MSEENVRNLQPWYEVGEDVRTALTMEEAMKQGHLDFEVQKVQAFIPTAINTDEKGGVLSSEISILNGMIRIPGGYATRRKDDGTPLGVVGSIYSVIQNIDAFTLFNPLLTDGSLRLQMAGCLGQNGERIWVLAEVGDPVLLVEGDELKRYIMLLNSHDGSTSLRVLNTPFSAERGTTLMAYDSERSLSIRHTASAGDHLKKARDIVARSLKFYENFVEAAHHLVAKKLHTLDVDKFIESLFPAKIKDGEVTFSTRAKNQMKTIRDLYDDEPVNVVKGTAWALYNAVTEFVDHHRSPSANETQKYRRLQSISVGSGAEMKKRTFDSLSKIIGGQHA